MISESSQASFDKAPGSNFMKNFSNSINSGLTSVNNNIEAADKAQESFAMGEDVSVHDVMIASEKAALSLQMAMQIRNKLISAYSEINNIRV
jgi:flagellar hook-basal body complex protein FliE